MTKKIQLVLIVVCGIFYSCNAQSSEASLEEKINKLEYRITELEGETKDLSIQSAESKKIVSPEMSMILNGSYRNYSRDHIHIKGYQIGHEGERGKEGFSLGESEINLSANVDDKFYGSLTFALVNEHDGDEIEIEEAYLKTIALPYGMSFMAGRIMPSFGYLNDRHAHTDDFADRPLPYRAFFNNHVSDDGIQASIVLPTDLYSEIGAGAYRGASFPADEDGNSGIGLYNIYARVGGDIGIEHAWRLGASHLHAKSQNHGREDGHGHMSFRGKDDFYIMDLKYSFSPNGNNREEELTFIGEYMYRKEKGEYDIGSGFYELNSNTTGWYAQLTYKFLTNWRIGYRYSEMTPKRNKGHFANTLLDSEGHKPRVNTLMAEWNNSEFSRIRAQYNYDSSDVKPDNQFILQYTISLGAHGAHSY